MIELEPVDPAESIYGSTPAVWVEDRDWTTPARYAIDCSRTSCRNTSDAELDRARIGRRIRMRWMGWCETHLRPYHRIRNGRVEVQVGADSRAAARGFVDSAEPLE